jgi:hypothetical protein
MVAWRFWLTFRTSEILRNADEPKTNQGTFPIGLDNCTKCFTFSSGVGRRTVLQQNGLRTEEEVPAESEEKLSF